MPPIRYFHPPPLDVRRKAEWGDLRLHYIQYCYYYYYCCCYYSGFPVTPAADGLVRHAHGTKVEKKNQLRKVYNISCYSGGRRTGVVPLTTPLHSFLVYMYYNIHEHIRPTICDYYYTLHTHTMYIHRIGLPLFSVFFSIYTL